MAPLVPVALAFSLGILAAVSIPCGGHALLGLGIAGGSFALCGRHRRGTALAGLLALWACLGAVRFLAWQTHPDAGLSTYLTDDPQPVQLHGTVADDPADIFGPHEADGQAVLLTLLHVRTVAGWRSIHGRVRATFHAPKARVAYGDEILVEGSWSRVPAPSNPGQYDWNAALARQRIGGLLRVKSYDAVAILQHGHGQRWRAAVFWLRHRWEYLIDGAFGPRDAGLLRSLLLGERVALDDDLRAAFVETGTIHLLIISGFNVGLVAGLLEGLLRLIGCSWRLRPVLIAWCLGGYCVLTGWQPPVVRATLMAWIVLGALMLDRVISWSNTLAAAALAILWMNPTQLFDPGFQLSFGAVWCLLLLSGPWTAWLDARLRWLHPAWFRRYLAAGVSTTSAVWAGLSPVLAWYFHLVSPVSLLANLLLAPLMSTLIIGGTALLILAAAAEAVLSWGRAPLLLLLQATLRCVAWCHALPGGHWFIGTPSPPLLAGYYGVLGLSIWGTRRGWRAPRIIVCWMTAIAVWIGISIVARAADARWLQVDVLDVGHGDSICIRTPRGHTILVDAGSQEASRFRVVPYLRHIGITTLDALVLTQTDDGHVGGALPLVHAVRVERLLTNGLRDNAMSARRLRRAAAAQHIPEVTLASRMTLEAGSGVKIEALQAPEASARPAALRVTRGAVSILLTGDLETAGLPQPTAGGAVDGVIVLAMSQDSNRSGQGSDRPLRNVRPQVVILSDGRARHRPLPETVGVVRSTGALVLSTRDDGAIRLRTDGVQLEIRTIRSRRRYALTAEPARR